MGFVSRCIPGAHPPATDRWPGRGAISASGGANDGSELEGSTEVLIGKTPHFGHVSNLLPCTRLIFSEYRHGISNKARGEARFCLSSFSSRAAKDSWLGLCVIRFSLLSAGGSASFLAPKHRCLHYPLVTTGPLNRTSTLVSMPGFGRSDAPHPGGAEEPEAQDASRIMI